MGCAHADDEEFSIREQDNIKPIDQLSLSDIFTQLFRASVLERARTTTDTTSAHRILFEQLVNAIEQRMTDPDLSLDSLAERLRCSKSYLHLIFRKYSPDETIQAHIMRLRLNRARESLTAGSGLERTTIADVAYGCGFDDPSYFSRVFRKRFGTTPQAFRQAPR